MDDASLFERLKQQVRAYKRLQAEGAPHLLQRLVLPGVEAFTLADDPSRAWYHPVFFDSAGALAAALPALEDFFSAAGVRTWRVLADGADTEAARLLTEAGYHPGETTWAMGLDLAAAPAFEAPAGLEVVAADGLLPVNDAIYGPSPAAVVALLRHTPRRAVHALLAREEGRPVSGGFSVDAEDTTGIYGVVTAPAARGRGHARRVMRGLLAAAQERGLRASVLQSSAMARSLYAALGYRLLGTEVHWVRRQA